MRGVRVVIGLSVAMVAGGCATAPTGKPQIPAAPPATLTPLDLAIDTVDDRPVRGGDIGALWAARNVKSNVPAGRHEIGISRPIVDGGTVKQAGFANLCFDLVSGHDYRVRAIASGGGSWAPEVTDATTGVVVAVDCAASGAAPDRVVTGSAAAPPAAWAETPDGDNQRRPGNGPGLRAAITFGGDTLVSTASSTGDQRQLDAGGGTTVALAWLVTPLWTERVGFGAGVELGWKIARLDTDNGSARFTRYPLVLSVHALSRLSRRWYVLAGAGVEKHFATHLQTDGAPGTLSVDLDSHLGAMGELGLRFWARRHLSIEVDFRFTVVSYEVQGVQLDGTNAGFGLAVRFDL